MILESCTLSRTVNFSFYLNRSFFSTLPRESNFNYHYMITAHFFVVECSSLTDELFRLPLTWTKGFFSLLKIVCIARVCKRKCVFFFNLSPFCINMPSNGHLVAYEDQLWLMFFFSRYIIKEEKKIANGWTYVFLYFYQDSNFGIYVGFLSFSLLFVYVATEWDFLGLYHRYSYEPFVSNEEPNSSHIMETSK